MLINHQFAEVLSNIQLETMARGGVFWVLRNLCSLNGGEVGLYAPGNRVTTPELGTLPLLGMV